MKILVINCGSSSVKYQLFEMPSQVVLASGMLERVGMDNGRLKHRFYSGERSTEVIKDGLTVTHESGIALIAELLYDDDVGVLEAGHVPDAVGHRVVHGGEYFQQPALIDEAVIEAIRQTIPLAPLHNPANLTGIEQTLALFPKTPQVAVFDTAFHQTMPPHAYRYALPDSLYQEHAVRRYGFHGTSHSYVARAAAEFLEKPLSSLNLITLHLGNGASVTAIENGRSIETSMGLTPVEGLIMGTRSGDLDPAVPGWLMENLNLSSQDVDALLNKQSGLKGICGSNDMRDILARRERGDASATLAFEMFCHRLRKYIGAYYAVLGEVDGIVFTGGIGENAAAVRSESCAGLQKMGIQVDSIKNQANGSGIQAIHHQDSGVAVLVVPTNEELEIARQVTVILNHCDIASMRLLDQESE
ncbi:MAG: acetate kinase [Chloroflexota bacterium]